MSNYARCEHCGLIHFSEENACPRCGGEELSGLVDREQVGFKEALEYAQSIAPGSLFGYSLCSSLIADFAPHLKKDWKLLLCAAFDSGAIEELHAESGLIRKPGEKVKRNLSRFLGNGDRDLILFAYMECLYPEFDLPRIEEEPVSPGDRRDVFQGLVNCLVQIVELKRLESSGALENQIASLEHRLKVLKRYSSSVCSSWS